MLEHGRYGARNPCILVTAAAFRAGLLSASDTFGRAIIFFAD
jgi:hypothetical protein